MATPNPRKVLSRKLRTESNSLDRDITILVRPDGGTEGDMDINSALDFCIRHNNLRQTVDATWGAGKRPPVITLSLLEGEHTVDANHMRIHGLVTNVLIHGPAIATNTTDPLAVINLTKDSGAYNWQFVQCDRIWLENVWVKGSLRGNKYTILDFNPYKSVSDGYHVRVDEAVWLDSMSSSYNGSSLTCASISAQYGSVFYITELRLSTEYEDGYLSGSTPMISAYYGGLVHIGGSPDCTDYGAGTPTALSGTNPLVRADHGGKIIMTGDLTVPNDRTGGVGVNAQTGSSIVISGNVDWNGRTAGDSVSTALQADGSSYNVTGTVTP